MPLTPLWTYNLPSECIFDGLDVRSDWIGLNLYCKNEQRTVIIELSSGRTTVRGGREPELRGVVERKADFLTLRCFRGFGNRVWSRIVRAPCVKMVCRKEVCVAGFLKSNYSLEVNVINARGGVVESITLSNTLDFDIGAASSVIALSTTSPYPEHSTVLFVDAGSGSILDEYTGFGGRVISSPSLIAIYGEHGREMYTRVYNDDGEEVISDEGIALFIPYNPFPFQLPGTDVFNEKYLIVMDKHNLKIYSVADYNLEYMLSRPPYARGVFDVNPEAGTITTLSIVNGYPLVVSYGFRGDVLWQSHIVRQVSRVLHSNTLVTIFDEKFRKETRIAVIRQPVIIEEERLGPGIEPLHVWGRNVVLFDGEKVIAYAYE